MRKDFAVRGEEDTCFSCVSLISRFRVERRCAALAIVAAAATNAAPLNGSSGAAAAEPELAIAAPWKPAKACALALGVGGSTEARSRLRKLRDPVLLQISASPLERQCTYGLFNAKADR